MHHRAPLAAIAAATLAATCHAPSVALEHLDARTLRLTEAEAAECARGCVLLPQADLMAYLAHVRAQAFAAGHLQGEAKGRAEARDPQMCKRGEAI